MGFSVDSSMCPTMVNLSVRIGKHIRVDGNFYFSTFQNTMRILVFFPIRTKRL